MKRLCIAFSLLIPLLTQAEESAPINNGDMSEKNMQIMSQKMQDMQKCMATINKKDLDNVDKRSIQLEKKIRSLCSKGKRDQAQKEAISFSKDISTMPAMKSMKKCAEGLQGVIQGMPMPGQDMDFSNRHACDELSGTD